MTTIHKQGPFVDWVIGVLEAGDLTIGDGAKPATVPAGAAYGVVYSIAGGITDGTIDDPNEDAAPNIQVTSSSLDPSQCRWHADQVRALINAAVPAEMSDGRHVFWINFPMASMTMLRDDDVQPPRYAIPDRFELGTTP